MKFKVYKDRSGQWRWTLIASNGRKIANCGEGYKRKAHCLAMVRRVQCADQLTPIIEA